MNSVLQLGVTLPCLQKREPPCEDVTVMCTLKTSNV